MILILFETPKNFFNHYYCSRKFPYDTLVTACIKFIRLIFNIYAWLEHFPIRLKTSFCKIFFFSVQKWPTNLGWQLALNLKKILLFFYFFLTYIPMINEIEYCYTCKDHINIWHIVTLMHQLCSESTSYKFGKNN